MSTIEKIKRAIQQLPPEKLIELRAWFASFDAEPRDRDLDEHARAGRLDQLGDDALADLDEGRCTSL